MILHENTTNALINHLAKHGYPKDRIAVEWGTKQFAIDLVVLAQDYMTPVSIFEIKTSPSMASFKAGLQQLKKGALNLPLNVQCTLVFSTEEAPYFIAYDVTQHIYGNVPIDYNELLSQSSNRYKPISYERLTSGLGPKLLTQKLVKWQSRIGRLKTICWLILPLAAIDLLVFDSKGIFVLTTERLIILGVCVIVVLIPFFSEISIKDITLKRDKDYIEKK